ncbi:MAG: Asp23/Gls24 family envelope stress response protein [Firmicutes bacterium]|nr:Asp23/Gls24 family envelope stress response protein [Bacillota bacterium]
MAPNEEKVAAQKISDDKIANCVRDAALRTEGVASLSKGVRVSQNEKRVSADVYIAVEYGYRIPSVAWDIQEHVKKDLAAQFGLGVKAVNIYIQGVHIPKDHVQ